jgi:hypothetical protein
MKWVKAVAVLLLLVGLATTANAKKEVGVETIHNWIRQGESHWYYSYVTSSTFDVYLVWNNPSNSLTLTVYSPDGSVKAYRDGYDGKIDGTIKVRIKNAKAGYWFFRVYGERVEGIQFYSFAVYER